MRFSTDFLKAGLVMLRHFFPIWGGIAVFISLLGLLIAQLEQEISAETALYLAWVPEQRWVLAISCQQWVSSAFWRLS